MKISVIIPCYNCERFIQETVYSILQQSVLPIEIILINDSSSDDTLKILHELRKSNNMIKIFDFKINMGVSFCRNYAADRSNGDYVMFLDSDDLALPNLIEESQRKLNKLNAKFNDKYVMSYCSYVQIDENDNIISEEMRGIQTEPQEILGYEFLRNYISTSGVILKKESFYKACKFNEKLTYAEDWDLWLRIAQVGGFCYIDKPLIKVRRRNSSLSSNLENMKIGEKAILKQYNINFIEDAINKRNLPKYINVCDFVFMMFRFGNYDEGFKKLKELSKNYEYYNIYFLLGLYYIKNRKIDLSIDNFLKTIGLKKNHGAALNNIGALYMLKKDFINSKDFLKKALLYFPNYMDANYNLSLLGSKKDNINFKDVKFTWRELRENLLKYS